MESVLHDVPIPSDRFIYFAPAPVDEERNLVGITNVVPLVLADFSTVGLRRLGLTRSKVVDSEKSEYPATRLLAQWLYQNCPNIQGIQWTSRQYDLGQTIVLFESRLESNCLSVHVPSESIANDLCQDEILALITALGGGLKQG